MELLLASNFLETFWIEDVLFLRRPVLEYPRLVKSHSHPKVARFALYHVASLSVEEMKITDGRDNSDGCSDW